MVCDVIVPGCFLLSPVAAKDTSSDILSTERFDLSGRKVGSDAKGLVIEKTRYADGKTVSRKVLK